MPTKRAGDIMIPLEQYPHIPHWFTLRQAVAEIEKSVIEYKGRQSLPRALLVFDEKYRLLGIVRRRDILRALEPNFFQHMEVSHERSLFDVEVDPDLIEVSTDSTSKAIKKQAGMAISEVMLPIAATVNYGDHLLKVIHIMLEHDLNLLPVLKDGKVVGVVRSVDVFHEAANILL